MASADIGNDTLSAGSASIPAMGEEELRLAAGAVAGPLDGLDAGLAEATLDRLCEVKVPAVHDVVAEARAERLRDLVPHLVAARADPRPDRRGGGSGDGSHAVLEDALDHPAPADVQDDEPRAPVLPGEDDGEAVSREQAERAPRLLGPEPV